MKPKYLTLRITIGYYATFVILGLLTSLMGPAIPSLAENTQSSLAELSRFIMVGSFGYLLGGFLGGRLYDRFAGHLILACALLVSGIFVALIPEVACLGILGIVLFILGFAEGTLDTGGNSLITWVHGEKVGPTMNGLHFFFGLGASLAPLIIAQIVASTGNIFLSFWIFALAALPVSYYIYKLPSPSFPGHTDNKSKREIDWLCVGLLVALFFVYVGAEVGYGNWVFTYAITTNLSDEIQANYITSVFWISFTVGRLICIPIAQWIKPHIMMMADLFCCLLSVGFILLFSESILSLWIGTIGLGLGMASFFPSAMVLASRLMHLSGRVTGFFLFGSGGGGMVIPFIIGQTIEPMGPRSMMWILFIVLIISFFIFFALLPYVVQFNKKWVD